MFKATRMMGMQPTRAAFMRQSPILRMKPTQQVYLQQSVRMMRPVPKEEQSAHTISQRLRSLKSIPAELIPLGIVLVVAVGFAIFSMGKKLISDKTLRLKRQGSAE